MIVIIPVKAFASAKSRLAQTLSAAQRFDMARGLFRHTLDIVQSCQRVDQIEIVTADRVVAEIALSRGCNICRETAPGGLNRALEQGLAAVRASADSNILILPTDLPALCRADIEDLSRAGPALAPDSMEIGTNGLFFAMRDRPEFCFGPGSAIKHRTAFQKKAQTVRIVKRPGLAHDLDTPGDLQTLRPAIENGRFANFMDQPGQAA